MLVFYQFNNFLAIPLSFGLKTSYLIKLSLEGTLGGAIKLPDITMSVSNIIQQVIEITNQKLEISPKRDKFISISLWDFRNEKGNTIPKTDLKKVLRKLEEEQLIKLIFTDHLDRLGRQAGDKVEFQINRNAFDKFYRKNRNPQLTSKVSQTAKNGEVFYEVFYSEMSREIVVNGFQLAKPDFESENEQFFAYAYKNAYRRIPIKEIEENYKTKFKKSPHRILADLGFTGSFAKAFFSISRKGVLFRKKVTLKSLREVGIERLKIQEKKEKK